MALNIKNPEVEALVTEVAELTGETKTSAVRNALLERRERLQRGRLHSSVGPDAFMRFLREEVWPRRGRPHPPADQGRGRGTARSWPGGCVIADSSAIVELLLALPEAPRIEAALRAAGTVAVGASTLAETAIVLRNRTPFAPNAL